LIKHSRFLRVSLFMIVVNPFASVSIIGKSDTSPYSYFLKPRSGAISLKH
jgi:hypothetical protein